VQTKIISIIAPCYNEEENILIFYETIKETFSKIHNYDYQLIFADDCSSDNSVAIIKKIITLDHKVRLVSNSRNYGVYRNSFNALKYATGIATIPMLPVDMQDPPNLIPEFIKEFEKGFSIVAGVRYERDENFLMKLIRRTYYRFVTKFSDFQIPEHVGEFQLVEARIIEQLKKIDDYYPYTRGLIASLSSNRSYIEYKWQKRKFGKTKHNFANLIDQGINGVVSTSIAPLRALTIASSIFAIFGTFFGLLQVLAHFTFSKSALNPGVSTLIALTSFLILFIAISVGVISEYLAAIHSQVRGRSRVFESEIIIND
jgi:glycosyltransferase involved in cell wall biosynthesis